MLTAFQCETVGFTSEDGEVYCPDCAPNHALGGAMNDHRLDRYSAEESWSEGLDCGDCGAVIVEPDGDICTYHGAARRWRTSGVESRICEQAIDLDDARYCEFPEPGDPNPPRSRWVPCGTCGARDGERCDLEQHAEVERVGSATA